MSNTTLEYFEDFTRNCKVYTVTVDARDFTMAKLTPMDYALLEDIENGKPSDTPLADRLLGLGMIVRRIEESDIA